MPSSWAWNTLGNCKIAARVRDHTATDSPRTQPHPYPGLTGSDRSGHPVRQLARRPGS